MTLGGAFAPRDILSPIEEGLPILTNAESHPHVAAALLMPNNWWTMIMGAFDPRPATVLVAIPAPSRIFVSFDDAPPLIAAMHLLIAASGEIEEDLLSDEVYRFDGNTWTVAEAPVDAP